MFLKWSWSNVEYNEWKILAIANDMFSYPVTSNTYPQTVKKTGNKFPVIILSNFSQLFSRVPRRRKLEMAFNDLPILGSLYSLSSQTAKNFLRPLQSHTYRYFSELKLKKKEDILYTSRSTDNRSNHLSFLKVKFVSTLIHITCRLLMSTRKIRRRRKNTKLLRI